jgi:hypothetical protein
MTHLKVMLDTSVLKFAATKLERLIRVNKPTRNEQGEITGFMFYEPGYINRNERITNPELRREAELLPEIADLAKSGRLELLQEQECMYESWGVKNMDSATGLFYDAPITEAESPFSYGRILVGDGMKPRDRAKDFFSRIEHERFRTLGKITGAYQGKHSHNLNQLRDAFYIWSAEHNKCEYLLTMDFKLIRIIERDKKHDVKVKLVKPSRLLDEMRNSTDQPSNNTVRAK